MNLFSTYNLTVDSAYIIRVKGLEDSERKSADCAASCEQVGQQYEYWEAYNGVEGELKPPSHHNSIMDCIKIIDHYMTRGEVACALSHISLWAKCVTEDKPLVVLEHDSIMTQPYTQHAVYNSICYLGSHEQVKNGWAVLPTPPHASEGPNYHFICRAHAYAIDPAVAKNMLAYVIKYGITGPLDILLRADLFPIHQMGVYAYNEYDGDLLDTTIKGRPLEGRSTTRNDDLKI